MENLSYLMDGFQTALTFQNLGAAMLGAVLGIIVGAMPGIGSLAGVALLLPLTFKFNPTTAIIMLGALYYSNMFGGAFSAILINIPGDGPAVMTTLDGYPMAQKGRPGPALMVANTSSFIGGLIGMVILTFLGPALARVGLFFGPVEMAALLLVAMTSISWLVGDNPTKGMITTLLGILIATMGMDAVTGMPRYSFGNVYLLGGIPFTPLVIGFVGFSQIIEMMMDRKPVQVMEAKLSIKDSLFTKGEFKRLLPPAIRSGLLGTFIGVLPGAVEGVAACEAANNAAAGAFAPLLALGIPGSGTGAVLLGGLMLWGLNPGPLLFQTNPEFAWGLIASLFIANLITLAVAVAIIPFLINILSVPAGLMIPAITVVCVVGSFSTTNSLFGVIVMLACGLIGYLFKEGDYPVQPLVLAVVLAKLLEVNFRRAFLTSGGSISIFFTRPISLVFMIILITFIATPIVKWIIRKLKTN